MNYISWSFLFSWVQNVSSFTSQHAFGAAVGPYTLDSQHTFLRCFRLFLENGLSLTTIATLLPIIMSLPFLYCVPLWDWCLLLFLQKARHIFGTFTMFAECFWHEKAGASFETQWVKPPPHLMLECWIKFYTSACDPASYKCSWGVADDGPSARGPATHKGGLDGALVSWLHPGPALATVCIGERVSGTVLSSYSTFQVDENKFWKCKKKVFDIFLCL